MIRYNGLDLFSSGPAQIEPGALMSRDALAEQPGSIGATLIGQGLSPREIKQHGSLIGDDESALRGMIQAIEQQVGTTAGTLIDDYGNTWPNCVLRVFQYEPIHRLGPRLACSYTLTYLQTTP